ncbi:DNA protecting protein DprA [Tritonibacter multivorans]|uniref:DNA protecting protein DprA n=1 Tax=Tritonibacter multivorans TaxID=928856 RepID=A0A0P1G178_9RHOB|nr:DNA-processing protein DprA [Tritonibacter multivorans]MDA7419463.1 DNA-processing protein DprA [Tritonibacter multivorans]CUH75515.1 DNA protecting protein DprA [Tritonibacter multivorans]SFC66311.1 DNA processing protein [Tritonibacter multivorans]
MTGEAHSSYHPPLPPTTEDQRYSWLRLLRSRRIGVSTFYRLMAEYGTAQNVLDALPKVAAEAGVKGYKTCPEAILDAEIAKAKAAKARLLCFGDPDYPPLLMQLKTAPPVLWAVGDLSLLHRSAIAMVGARNASSLGLRMARALARDLGELGQVVTSGLARGIDAAAHQACVDTGTIAVLGGGVDVVYPSENADLAAEIREKGLLLSEQPMGLAPQARHFPARNRIIAGLSAATVVVEAAAKSGSLITARDALDMGRDVLAVPGHPMDARASGCNILIREGATLVRDARDVVDALPAPQQPRPPLGRKPALADLPPQPERRSLRETAALHGTILSRTAPSPTPQHHIVADSTTDPRAALRALTELEMGDDIDRAEDGTIRRK